MIKDKKSFLIHIDSLVIFEKMSDAQIGAMFRAIRHFHVTGEVPKLDFALDLAITPFINQFKRDAKKWNNKKEDRAINGRIGNLKRWNIDLYKQYSKGLLSLEEAEHIAKGRKVSPSDDSDSVATNLSQKSLGNGNGNVNGNVNVNENVKEKKEKSDLRKRKILAFDSFWQTYGLKQDRKKCMNKFLKLSEQDISDIDAYLKNVYFPHLKQNTWQKKRNPLTFLNSEDWKQGEKIEAQGTSQSMYETEIINGQEYELRICPNDPFETRQRRRLGDESWAIDTNYEQRKEKAKSEM